MKLLLDESVPRRLASSFPESFTVRTVQQMGWTGTGNGLLLSLAAGEDFDAFLTVDRGIEHQQNVNEQVIYQSGSYGGIIVTKARFVVGGETYAMQGVTSVRGLKGTPSKRRPLSAIGFGAFLALVGWEVGGSVFFLLMGLAVMAGGVYWWTRLESAFHIVLRFASGESKVLSGQDGDLVREVVDAVNEALVARG